MSSGQEDTGETDGVSTRGLGCQVKSVSHGPGTQLSDDEGALGTHCSTASPDGAQSVQEGVWSRLSDTHSSWP